MGRRVDGLGLAIDRPTASAPSPSSPSDANSSAMAAAERSETRSPSTIAAQHGPAGNGGAKDGGNGHASPTTPSAHCTHTLPTTWMSTPTRRMCRSVRPEGNVGRPRTAR